MTTASDIDFYDKVTLAEHINLSDVMPQIRKLFQYRKELARRIIETGYDNEAYKELFRMNTEIIKSLLGL